MIRTRLSPWVLAAVVAAAASAGLAQLPRSPAPQDAAVYILAPKDGAKICGPVKVVFGLHGMGVAPAGVERNDTGHHHLLIDVGLPATDKPIPSDDQHRHFGGGQTEVVLDLPPGEHTLQLLLGDYLHIPHDPPVVSRRITIHVTE